MITPPAASRRSARPRGLRLAAMLCGALVTMLAAPAARATDPEWVAAGSLVFPGLGQAANGDWVAGGAQFGLYLVLANQYAKTTEDPTYIKPGDREDDQAHVIHINRTSADADLYGAATLDLSFYSAFSAYRDSRNQPANQGDYRTPAPQESLTDLALAPFTPEYLLRPTTIAPLLIPLYLAIAPAPADSLVYQPDDSITRSGLARRFFVMHSMVAVGEESFFRGFLNNGLSDTLGEGWGLAASSVIFGLGHSGTAGQATALGATLFGAYLGWLHQLNGYAIGQGVAIHFWWNLLASVALLKEHETAQVMPFSIYLRF